MAARPRLCTSLWSSQRSPDTERWQAADRTRAAPVRMPARRVGIRWHRADLTAPIASGGAPRAAAVLVVVLATACGGGGAKQPRVDAVTTSTISAPPPAANDSGLAAQAAALVREHRLPAVAITRISADGSVRTGIAGVRSHSSDVELNVDAPFHLGSNTKAMTALLLATFVEAGDLDLDTTLRELYATIDLEPPVADATLRDVLGHRAGLDDRTLDLGALRAATDSSAARASAVRDALRRPGIIPGTFSYANVNFMLAGDVAERLGGDSWEHLVTARVFTPLGITCGFGGPVGPTVPLGHTAQGEPIPDDADVVDNPPALGPAGTVHCTMADWARFAGAVLAGLRGEDSAVASAATVADLFDDDHEYVAGWGLIEDAGMTIYTHDGSNTLWYARVVLLVERDEALLVATNTGEPGAIDAMDEATEAFITG